MAPLGRRNRQISFTPLPPGYGRAVRRFGLGAELHRAYVRRHTRQSTRLKALRSTEPYTAAETEEAKKAMENEVIERCAQEHQVDVQEVERDWRRIQSLRGFDVGEIDINGLELKDSVMLRSRDTDAGLEEVMTAASGSEKTQFVSPDIPLTPGFSSNSAASSVFEFQSAFPKREQGKAPGSPTFHPMDAESLIQPMLLPSSSGPPAKRRRKSTKKVVPAPPEENTTDPLLLAENPTPNDASTQTPPPAQKAKVRRPRKSTASAADVEAALGSSPAVPADTDVALTAAPQIRRGPKQSTSEDPTKPYMCQLCQNRFRRREHLKRHLTTLHTKEKPFTCPECGKKCSREDNLAQHVKTHDLKSGEEGAAGPGDETDEEMLDAEGTGKKTDWEFEAAQTMELLRQAAATVAAEDEDGGKEADEQKKEAGEGASGANINGTSTRKRKLRSRYV